MKAEEITSEWQLFSKIDGVEMYLRKEDCKLSYLEKELSFTFIKLKNTSDERKNIKFQVARNYTTGICMGCEEESESFHEISVPSKSSIENDCSFKHSKLSVLIANPNLKDNPLVFESIELIKFYTE